MNAGSAGIKEYLKRAFLYRWNLLLFFGGFVALLLTPWWDAMLPLLLAAEIAYLGGLVSTPKFRDAIDAQVYKEGRQQPPPLRATPGGESLVGIMSSLSPEERRRFETLRSRCLEMRSLARGVGGQSNSPTEDLSTPALDRLLWVFLRLLVSQQGLDRLL